MAPRHLRAALWLLFLVLMPAGVTAAPGELREYPLRSASGAELQRELRSRLSKTRPPVVVSKGDVDLNHVAVLEDDGTLIPQPANRTAFEAIAARFYATHGDDYDYLCIFVASTFVNDVEPEAGFAYQFPVANSVQGINQPLFNDGNSVAPGVTRLRSILNMNDLGEYSENPSDEEPAFINAFSGIDVLGQEAGHMVGSYTPVAGYDILGRADAHWSFFLETGGSVMEGNGWRDNGDGTFTTVAAGDGYSPWDLYHFGFLLPSAVTEPAFVLLNPTPDLAALGGPNTLPTIGVTVAATQQAVTIDDVIAANGPRVPDANSSPKTFTMAFILVVPQGQSIAPRDMERIDDFRVQWCQWFDQNTQGIGTMDTELGTLAPTADFEARAIAGSPGVTVEFDNDSFGSIDGYLWEFGDGNTSVQRHPVHTYSQTGSYTVTLTLSGPGGPVSVTRPDFVRVGTPTIYFADDFEIDRGWTTDPGDLATSGQWVRADPVGTAIVTPVPTSTAAAALQPEDDHTPLGTHCLVTGNTAPGGGIGEQDVDGGRTTIASPSFDLSAATDPVLSFWSWFSNNGGAQPGRDTFQVELSDDGGGSWTRALTLYASHHRWRQEQVRISDFIGLTSQVRVRFQTADEDGFSLVEAAVDDVEVFDVDVATSVASAGPALMLENHPNPFSRRTTIRFGVRSPREHVRLNIYDLRGKLVRTLRDEVATRGAYEASWNGRDDHGRPVAVGTYFYRLETSAESTTRKMVLLR